MSAEMFREHLLEMTDKALGLGVRILLSIVVLLVGTQLIKLICRVIKRYLTRAKVDIGVIQFSNSFIRASLYVLLVFMIVSGLGVDAASIVALLGSAGVAIGLAIQGSLSNFAGGVLILVLKPFKVGDYIKEDATGNEGTVSEIQLFYTKLMTPDNQTVILPNGTLANTSMTNVTAADCRRMDIKVNLAYDEEIAGAREVIMEVLRTDADVRKDKDMRVFVDCLGESAVVLNVRCWFDMDKFWEGKWRVTEAVKNALDGAHIRITYPQVDVHLKEQEHGGSSGHDRNGEAYE